MSYVEGFLAAVPTANKAKFKEHAEQAAPVFRKHGATRCVECWGDDVPKGETTDFYRAVKAKDDEIVVFSWMEWPDKATRDAGMAKVMDEMPAIMEDNPMPFDGKRPVFGGFEVILDSKESRHVKRTRISHLVRIDNHRSRRRAALLRRRGRLDGPRQRAGRDGLSHPQRH